MKKVIEKRAKNATEGVEDEVREVLREFAKKTLDTPKLRDAAAKKIGGKPSYVQAMLRQRGIGGMNSWIPLIAYCFELRGLSLTKLLARVLEHPATLNSEQGLKPSEAVFRGLDQISIVNEDVKLQLATSLELMLKDLEKSLDSHKKKRS